MRDAHHPVVLFANGFGDHLLNLPALRALASVFQGRLGLICLPGIARWLYGGLPLRGLWEVPMRRGGEGRLFDAQAVAARIGTCELLASLCPWHSESVDALLAHLEPRSSIGFFPGFRVRLPLDYARHTVDLAFEVPRQLEPSLRVEDFAAAPSLPSSALRLADEVKRLVGPRRRILAVHTETGAEKQWPVERFVTLLDAFLERHPEYVALVLDQESVGLDRGRQGGRILHRQRLDFDKALALIQRADLFVGIDSSMLHGADLFRVPGVGLFAPTRPEEFGFRFGPHRHVHEPRGMEAIAVEQVLEALEQLALIPTTRA
ncbi:glycosyltransferase family 9 protein [Cystobacter fuscus]|uniref:glycosyltransferase family 9 protein n=1 Tax=Cystobacter fuscus TaxID=43 RepID=UPI0037BF53D9